VIHGGRGRERERERERERGREREREREGTLEGQGRRDGEYRTEKVG
jgi:hypothetical protein